MENLTKCPNCGAELKDGVFKSNSLISEKRSSLINEYTNNSSKRHCGKCRESLLSEAKNSFAKEYNSLNSVLNKLLNSIPVISIHSPTSWKYTILKMVTGQSVTGTGAISDFSSSVTDFFGSQSGSYNTKLKNGEDKCIAQLRRQALDVGANAVLATDIDYSEVGASNTGMLMVCMAGTAVRINNASEVLDEKLANDLVRLDHNYTRFNQIRKFKS